ncbi:Uma2 family endonuclease [Streptomyces sp. NRRL S-87]|uniref:Uma2 family endonuclease n=1 Tax=Streptomyces sp. NRRL S-87 TaxID=1463920 RepID=UPI0004C14576|nr:Uma2 family endonuclease [Streptomyces sp. NRRL S-87]
MTALAHEAPEVEMPQSDLDEALWLAWKAAVEKLPEGFRAEIIEGSIEVSPTGRRSHMQVINRLRRALEKFLEPTEYVTYHDGNVVHERKLWIPDLFVALEDLEEVDGEADLATEASAVETVVEVVSPGYDSTTRDRVRKRRAYARAGIPVYVLIDAYDGHGTVSILTAPDLGRADYTGEVRTQFGREVAIPEGPAKGFVIGEEITGPARNAPA